MMLRRGLGVSPGCHLQHYHRMHDTWAKYFSDPKEGDKEMLKDRCCSLIIVRD
jgi:hypothetical protein